jgi:transcriptional regulator with XRE-family HTH domain
LTLNGGKIRARRKQVGMTQAALAKAVGISAAHMSDIEANKGLPSLPLIIRIAEALGVKVDDLLDGAK